MAAAPILNTSSTGPADLLPLIIRPGDLGGEISLEGLIRGAGALAKAHLSDRGGILFRGFNVLGEVPFQKFAASFGFPLLAYEHGSTPRTNLGAGVYSSTEYPAHQEIPLHNEQSYTLGWPMKIWFHCMEVAPSGGETPVVDSRRVYARIDPEVRQRFAQKKLRYIRNYTQGLDVPWQTVFQTTDRRVVEAYCAAHHIKATWLSDDGLRTEQVCQSVARHPETGEDVWFNQAHLFHISNLAEDIREALLMLVDSEEHLPRNVTYGDGTPIETGALDHVRSVLAEEQVRFPWEVGDILMLDNMLVAHGRTRFKGPRKVVVAMAEPNA